MRDNALNPLNPLECIKCIKWIKRFFDRENSLLSNIAEYVENSSIKKSLNPLNALNPFICFNIRQGELRFRLDDLACFEMISWEEFWREAALYLH